MNRAQRRYRAARVHGSREYRQAVAYRSAEIHKCNQDCIVQTVERPAARRRIIAAAAAVAISIAVPAIVIVLLAAATYLFGK